MYFKFERLSVWNRSIDYSATLFRFAACLPKQFHYSIGDQLKRAALSIPTNIAEGSGRGRVKDQANFYRIAKGSIYETISILSIAKKLDVISRDEFQIYYSEANQIAAMLTGLMKPKNIQ